MDPNVVHRQFLPGYGDPATWSSILYNYGGQGPASQLHDLRAEQPRALPHDSQRQQISGHDIAEFFARNAPPPVTILNECHLQAQPPPPQPVTTSHHDVVLDLGLSAVVAPKKSDKAEPIFIQDAVERSRFDKRRVKALKSTLNNWYKRSGSVTVALTYLDGQVHISGPDHMLSLSSNEEFKNIFVNALTSYDQLSRLAEIVSNCNEEENVTGSLNSNDVQGSEIPGEVNIENGTDQGTYGNFDSTGAKQPQKKASGEPAALDQDCKLCPQKFSSKHFLKKHMLEAHNQVAPLLVCPFCNKRFMTRWKLDRHTIIHTGAKPYNCIYCPKRFAEKNKLVVHVKNHKEGFVDPQAVERLVNSLLPKRKTTHECLVCGKSFMSSWKLNRHIRVHSGEKPYKCSKCSKSFNEKSKLDQHELLPHDGTRVRPNSQEKRHECDKCDKKFVSLWKLKRHELFHSGERPWQCDRCGKGFVENNKLMLHIKFYHTDKESPDAVARRAARSKKYECTDCNKKFATHWKLKRHSQTHSLERPFRCEVCKRGFLTKNKLDLHNFTLHSEEGEESAAIETTTTVIASTGKANLQEEISIPEAESSKINPPEPLSIPGLPMPTNTNPPYVSELSNSLEASQPVSAQVEKVTLTVTDPTAIDANVEFTISGEAVSNTLDDAKTCRECGKSFKTPSRLKRHMAVHTGVRPFKCTLCEKGFTERNKLLNHLKGHGVDDAEAAIGKSPSKADGAGKHQCSFCEKNFVSPWKLKRHLTVHTGNKPFFCKICQRAFTEKNKLENHFRSSHPEDMTLLEEELSQVEVTMVEPESAFSIVARSVDERIVVKQESEKGDANDEVSTDLHLVNEADNNENETFPSSFAVTGETQTENENSQSRIKELMLDSKKPLKYACQVCGKSFITPSKLKRHSFSHGEQKPYKCKKCGKRFSENNKLFNHLVTHEKFKGGKLITKIRLKEEGDPREDAGRSMAHIHSSSSVIVVRGTESAENSEECDISNSSRKDHRNYPSEVDIQRKEVGNLRAESHIKDLAASEYSEPSPDMPVILPARDIIKSNSEQLKMLVENALGSSTKGILDSPKKTGEDIASTNMVTMGAGKGQMAETLKPARQLKKVTGLASPIFGTQTANVLSSKMTEMSEHQTHSDQLESSRTASQLYSCDTCHESFLSYFSLKQHITVNHPEQMVQQEKPSDEMRHRCTECHKGFKTPSKLKRHLLSHTGETPYHCHLCPRQFKRNDSLRKHLEEHNRTTDSSKKTPAHIKL